MSEESKYPDRCPITNLPLFMGIEHPVLGEVPTYGGPYDSYTIPEIDEDGDFCSYRYDHDEGCWVDGVENVGNATDIIVDLRAKLSTAEKQKDDARRCYQTLSDRNNKLLSEIAVKNKVLDEQLAREEDLEAKLAATEKELETCHMYRESAINNMHNAYERVAVVEKELRLEEQTSQFWKDRQEKLYIEYQELSKQHATLLLEDIHNKTPLMREIKGLQAHNALLVGAMRKIKEAKSGTAVMAHIAFDALDTTPAESYERYKTQLSILQDVANAASAVMDVLGRGDSVEPGDVYYESLRIALDRAGWDESDAAERVQGLVEALERILLVPREEELYVIDTISKLLDAISKICSIADNSLQRYRGDGK